MWTSTDKVLPNGEIIGLLPGQQLMGLPNGLATIVDSSQTNIVGQSGVSILASCVAPGVLTDATGTAIKSNTITVRPSIPESVEEENDIPPQRSTFSRGDHVKLVSEFAAQKARSPEFAGLDDAIRMLNEAVGTVQFVSASMVVTVKFKSLETRSRSCDSSNLIKVNPYSLKQVIQIRSDAFTLQQIENKFKDKSDELKGATGYVSGIDQEDPSGLLFVKFDDPEIYDWLPKSVSLPSAWMEPYKTAHPAADNELLALASRGEALFFKAVEEGNLRNAKVLRNLHGVDAQARNPDGKTALHLASFKGHYAVVQWLLEIVKVKVNKLDYSGYSAIHYAALGCKSQILELLLMKGASVDSQTERGDTSLHFAALHQPGTCSCLRLLSKYKANANHQNAEGNTPLHVAIEKGCAGRLLRHFSFTWGLRNQKGFNIIQQAVIFNDLKTVKFIMAKDELCQALFELLPNSRSTVLHQACTNKNFKMVKLLVGESEDLIMLDRTELLEKFLETQNESGKTALLIACENKDYSIVDLLVEAGADVKAADKDGNTAILLSAYDPVSVEIPTEEYSPNIYKVYQDALRHNADTKMIMENNPILSLIAYLIVKGSSLEATNKAGDSGIDAVLSQGSSSVILDMVVGFVYRSLADASNGMSCMGRDGCIQKPEFLLCCPHKQPGYKLCSSCLLSCEKMKHGCLQEKVTSIAPVGVQQLMDLSRIQAEKLKDATISHPALKNFTFTFKPSSRHNGSLRDQMGNNYSWCGKDGGNSILFRCDKRTTPKDRCPAVARRFKSEEGTPPTMSLISKHNHSVVFKRNTRKENRQEGSPTAGPSTA